MLVLEQLMDKFAQFTFSNQPLLLILLAIVVTNVSFNFSSRFGNLELFTQPFYRNSACRQLL